MFLHPLAVTAFMVLGAATPSTTAAQEPSPACEVTQAKYASYTKTVYRERKKISDLARDRIDRLRKCAKSEEAERNMVELRRKEARDREERQREQEMAQAASSIPPHLQTIAACESGGSPTAISSGGLYRGKYQFDFGTWASVGGKGDPAAASEAEQDMRAAILYRKRGAAPWPVCGS